MKSSVSLWERRNKTFSFHPSFSCSIIVSFVSRKRDRETERENERERKEEREICFNFLFLFFHCFKLNNNARIMSQIDLQLDLPRLISVDKIVE